MAFRARGRYLAPMRIVVREQGVEPCDFVRRLHPELPRLADLYVLLHRAQVMRREAAAACAPAPEPR